MRFYKLCCAVLLCGVLAACGGGASDQGTTSPDAAPEATATEKGEDQKLIDKDGAEGQESTEGQESAEGTESAEGQQGTEAAEAPKAEPAEYILDNYVVVDDDNCTFSITSVEDSKRSVEFKVFCENKTDKTLMFSVQSAVLNGYSDDPFFACEVASGKKQNNSFSFNRDDLDAMGISSIDEMRIHVRIYDSDDWLADEFVDDEFTIYPTGMSADAVVYPDRLTMPDEVVAADNDAVSFVILGTDPDYWMGYAIVAYCENKTDTSVMFSWDDVSVNGYMCDPFWASALPPHSRSYEFIPFSSRTFEENDIETVEEIEYKLKIYDDEDWTADPIVEDVFTYMPV